MRAQLLALNVQHLHLLDRLFTELNVTRVAETEGLSQPAVSRTLKHLREVLGDPLLVKSGRGMALTERAELLRYPLREILSHVSTLSSDITFEPAQAEQAFTIGCADCLLPGFVARVIQRVVQAGPRLAVRFRMLDPLYDTSRALDTGVLDLVVSNHPNPREDLRTSALYTEEVVCLVRKGHAFERLQRVSLGRYLAARHLAPSQSMDGEPGPIMATMQKVGYRRQVAATVPEYNLVPWALAGSDLVFTTGRRFAEHQARLAPLAVVPAPREFDDMQFYQLWHQRKHASASNQWLRRQLTEIARRIDG
jgi:DNA-binding transcriptional LysR family regulator